MLASPLGMPEEPEETVAWTDVSAHAPVIARDGREVGHVVDVACLPEEDIFHGIVFRHSVRERHLLAPAADVARVTNRAVYLSVDSATVDGYDEFHELTVKRLGLRGVLNWKHLGWKKSSE